MCRNNLDNRNACNGHDTCNVQTTTGRQRATDGINWNYTTQEKKYTELWQWNPQLEAYKDNNAKFVWDRSCCCMVQFYFRHRLAQNIACSVTSYRILSFPFFIVLVYFLAELFIDLSPGSYYIQWMCRPSYVLDESDRAVIISSDMKHKAL